MELLHQCRYWVFDLDGTLTRPVHDFEHIRRELGLAPGADILATLADLPEPQRSALYVQLDDLERYYALKAAPAPGLHGLFEWLSERNCRFGILTRNTREFALLSLRAIGVEAYFDPAFVLGRDEAQPKPDPGGLQHLLSCWEIEPEDALMVGDYRYDLEAGRNAGLMTVHVDSREDRHWPELTDLRVQDLGELHALLQRTAASTVPLNT
ncbi:HAD family hydrolase [Marinobacterium aestuarii]|uniref:HAD family hydrolase n=1 Tax=Marinobacterium aestuarii TaxID=1821621 RepID=A0A1A9EWP4_9GAMM|nr:HAD family hydrolase [Marinobacterium aestuarii]ANG62336.1 HAD family hydrolase [Marinobacterium aestuarii]